MQVWSQQINNINNNNNYNYNNNNRIGLRTNEMITENRGNE